MEIVITLESYNDMFDDFDTRPFNERSLSADFINLLNDRMKKVDFDKSVTLILTMPKHHRLEKEERIIEKRLKEYFSASINFWAKKARDSMGASAIYMLGGLAVYVVGGMFDSYISVIRQYMLIPAWFMTWKALEMIVVDYPKMTSRKQFYRYISNSRIIFKDDDFYKA